MTPPRPLLCLPDYRAKLIAGPHPRLTSLRIISSESVAYMKTKFPHNVHLVQKREKAERHREDGLELVEYGVVAGVDMNKK